MDITSLMSPAEEPAEAFNRDSNTHHQHKAVQPPAQRQPPSPPISPYTTDVNHHTDGPRDPIVVPDAAAPESAASQPLFRDLTPAGRRTIEHHVRQNQNTNPTGNFPTREEYAHVAYFCENMMGSFTKNPRTWLARERNQLAQDNRARITFVDNAHHHHHRHRAVPRAQPKPTASSPRSHLPSKTPLAPRPPGNHVAPAAARPDPVLSATAPRHPNRVEKTAPQKSRAGRVTQPTERASASASQASRVRQAAATKEDKDWKAIPDYCPPLTSLKNSAQGKEDIQLKVEWKGANSALDLSNDPLRHLLHPSELIVASHLRLDCATYLTSKRRIFHRRLVHYHDGKEFRKTHAQNATHIDVNKASKLHTAFEEVGWFRPEWMRNFGYPPDLVNP